MRLYPFCLWAAASLSLAPLGYAATLTVNTVENDPAHVGPGLSLLDALKQAKAGDTIAFNISGPGPHTIVTPLGGYPFITVNHLTIDGYTQPGSSPNNRSFAEPNNATIQIILDSSDAASADSTNEDHPELVQTRSTRMVFANGDGIPGYGDSENGILAVLGASDFKVQGISFLGRHTPGSTADPSIYSVALAKGAVNAKVQGCFFGLHPDGKTIQAPKAAVTGFRYQEQVDGATVSTFSSGLVFGTDGDGVNDRAEANICMGLELALGLELPGARISGNRFNVFADGNTFLDVKTYASTTEPAIGSMEILENGRGRENFLFGTDGNGVSDADERNVCAPAMYEELLQVYGGNIASNNVIAGNFFGIGVDGATLYPFDSPAPAHFFSISGAGAVRIGSNGDGVSDALEANQIFGVPGSRLVDAGATVNIVARGNRMAQNGFLGFPFQNRQNGRDYTTYPGYTNALLGPIAVDTDVLPTVTDSFGGSLGGTVPVPNRKLYPYSVVDVYLQDADADASGRLLPGEYLGSFTEASTQDGDLGENAFRFNLKPFKIAAGTKLVVAVTYSMLPGRFEADSAVTGPLSEGIAAEPSAGAVIPVPTLLVEKSGADTNLSWTAEQNLLRLESSDDLHFWTPVLKPAAFTAGKNSVGITLGAAKQFYRLAYR